MCSVKWQNYGYSLTEIASLCPFCAKPKKTKTKSGKRKLKSTGNVEPSMVQNVTIREYTRHVTPRKAFIKLSVTMLLIRSLNRVIILIFNLENIYYFRSCSGATISLHHSPSLLPSIPVRHLKTRGGDSHKKKQGMLVEAFEYNSKRRIMWRSLELH